MRYHEDDRRVFVGDVFDTPHGDFNAVLLNANTAIAWHRHRLQDDKIFVLWGSLNVRAIDPEGARREWHLLPYDPPIFIPRGWWHGYSTEAGATILQFNGPGKWDGSDEERHPIDDEMPWIATP